MRTNYHCRWGKWYGNTYDFLVRRITLPLPLSPPTHTHTNLVSYSEDKFSKKTWTTVLSPMISCVTNYITKFILTSLPVRTRLSQMNEWTGLYYIINLYQIQWLFNVEWYRIIPFAELKRIKRSWTTYNTIQSFSCGRSVKPQKSRQESYVRTEIRTRQPPRANQKRYRSSQPARWI